MKPQQKTVVGLYSFHQVEWEGVERVFVQDKKYDTHVARLQRSLKRQRQGRRNKRQWVYEPRTTDDLWLDICAAQVWYDKMVGW